MVSEAQVIAVVTVFGALLGSFLNVCILRLPLGESIVRPRSRCPKCGAPVLWYDNLLEAYRSDRWTGMVQQLGPGADKGELLFQYGKHSILTLAPVSATAESSQKSGGIPTVVWVVGGVALIAVIAGVVIGRRRRADEEEI